MGGSSDGIAERLYGYSEEEMGELSLARMAPIYEVPVVEAFLRDLHRGEIRRSETSERMLKDGTCVSVALRRTAIRDENGAVTGMVESARALEPRENDSPAEKQLRLLVEQMPVMLWTTDRQLRITSNWGSGFRLSKIGSGKLVGRTVPEFLRCEESGGGPVMRHFEALRGASSRFEYKRADRVLDIQVEPLRSFDGEIAGCMGVGLDVTERKRSEEQVLYQATHDALTGLANYREFAETLEREVRRADRSRNSFAVLLLDLDGLKQINDRSGHLAGNRALKRLANAMREHCRAIDVAARYGGDEFALVLIDADPAMAEQVAARIRACLHKEENEPPLGVSIGIASYPADGRTGQELLEAADQRLYTQKKETRKKALTAG
ncbi:MAG: sensor domain-containing diguanylate cyclase [Acidobacteria bacterium]|nr:sensor domain-containing diguanylate cyclase [Acidobacteriota bacterium]MBS1866392.1 sensor domain-containing diguanylate cyclase [Acidobacteriota bacterium]